MSRTTEYVVVPDQELMVYIAENCERWAAEAAEDLKVHDAQVRLEAQRAAEEAEFDEQLDKWMNPDDVEEHPQDLGTLIEEGWSTAW